MGRYPFRPVGPARVGPAGIGPAAPYPAGVPTTVAPVRRVVHPTRYAERHTATRYPVENVYPSHVRNVHHNVCEYYSSFPYSESHQVCKHVVKCPPRRY